MSLRRGVRDTAPLAWLALALTAQAGWAHTDPPGASEAVANQSLRVFSDAACTQPRTVIVGSAPQTLYLQATLAFSGLEGAASFELGRWRIETLGSCGAPGTAATIPPDPLVPVVPCIGDPVTSQDDATVHVPSRGLCAGTSGVLTSPCVPYVTTAADDAGGSILFQAVLGDADFASPDTAYAHIGSEDQAGLSSSVPNCVLIQPSCASVVVSGAVLDSTTTVESCGDLFVGPDVTVEAPGDVGLYAGRQVSFLGDFEAQTGSRVTIGACGHDLCTAGPSLAEGCTPCVTEICSVDPFCCATAWDDLCVVKIGVLCGFGCP